MRLVLGLGSILATVVLAVAAPAAASSLDIDRGIVQSVSSTQIVLRELDGSTASFSVDANTRVLLNGFPAQIMEIEPGFVAAVAHRGSAAARVIRAFGRVQLTTTVGVVAAISPRAITVRTPGGRSATFRITARTTIRVRGLPARVEAVKTGKPVAVVHTRAGEARRIAVGRPGIR